MSTLWGCCRATAASSWQGVLNGLGDGGSEMTVLSAGAALIAAVIPLAPAPVAGAPVAGAPVAGAPVAGAPETTCRVKDDRLVEISGLVADSDGYVVVNDGADEESGRKIFYLTKKCKVTRTVSYPSRPQDTEDMARGADGTLWIGDIGDNDRERAGIGVWRLAPGAKSPTLFRLSYPDGAHDAEALLIAGDGTPIVVTKDPLTAGVYVPERALDASAPVPLRRAGAFRIPVTTTGNPYGFKGRFVVTGAATSPDGTRVALRTYADAFEFDVEPGGSADAVVRAIGEGKPREIALPDEPQGESIAYTADGAALLSVSERTDGADSVDMLRYALPDAPAPVAGSSKASSSSPPSSSPPSSSPAKAGQPASAGRAESGGLPVGAMAAGGALIAAALVLGVVIARRRSR
ncbi:hypothetical protein Aph02nite_91310 [Actinoplanes philippinensis]|uniref:hypothetical protein n=1 Tax=Actinoplanes philippinensis TaxID=35752 RepID=UPI001A532B56|nr:hypothetical protein [Actinoplanes philippinensis]GIE83181.1 hypothetical protein Aph02nite_91310 [Actinoplanes philippinensis]